MEVAMLSKHYRNPNHANTPDTGFNVIIMNLPICSDVPANDLRPVNNSHLHRILGRSPIERENMRKPVADGKCRALL